MKVLLQILVELFMRLKARVEVFASWFGHVVSESAHARIIYKMLATSFRRSTISLYLLGFEAFLSYQSQTLSVSYSLSISHEWHK